MQDLALALALAAYNVGSLIPEARQLSLPACRVRAGGAADAAADLAAALAGRRCLAVGIPRDLYDQLGIGYAPLALASMIAYYTVMDRSSTRVRRVVSAADAVRASSKGRPLPATPSPMTSSSRCWSSASPAWPASSAAPAGPTWRRSRRAPRSGGRARPGVALAAARERTRIARELHDVVAHHVSLMAVHSEAAASLLPGRPAEAGKSVEIIGQTAREALTELRQLLGVLRDPAGPGRPPAGTAPAPSISELDEVLGPGTPGRDRRGPASGGQPGQAGARRGPDRLPDRARGSDQHGPALGSRARPR